MKRTFVTVSLAAVVTLAQPWSMMPREKPSLQSNQESIKQVDTSRLGFESKMPSPDTKRPEGLTALEVRKAASLAIVAVSLLEEPEEQPTTTPPVVLVQSTTDTGSDHVHSHSTDYGKWGPILQCESNGDWYISTGLYEGGLQFHPQTWDAYKPSGYPEAAYQSSPEQQIYVAELVLAEQGWGAWPACSRKAGYR